MACAFGVAVAAPLQHVWLKYRELGIKAKLDAECFDVLATDGMLVKRPLLVGDDFVIPGFKEETWAEALGLDC